jgi:hypothetical protein
MQRRNIRGSDLKPNPSQYAGMINAEKCVIYLRGIGVEIDDTTADSWLDIQGTYRFLRSEKTAWRTVCEWSCRCGAMRGHSERGRGRMRLKRKDLPKKPSICESCGTGFIISSTRFSVCRDGSVKDYRRGVDAVIPLRLDEWAGGL